MKNKKIILNYIIIGLIILSVAFLTATYAFWSISNEQSKENIINTACFNVAMENEQNAITIGTTYPITDVDGQKLQPFKFTIHNKCNDYASYQINLESVSNNVQESNRLSSSYIKTKINEVNQQGTPSLLSSISTTSKTLKDAYEAHKLTEGYLEPNSSKTFELRLWIDANTPLNSNTQNKTFNSKITITSAYLEESKVKK